MDVYAKKRAVFSYLVYKNYVKKRNRQYWVHPFTESRLLSGAFVSSFADLRENPEKFYKYFRMSVKSFDELAARISDKIAKRDTPMRKAVPPLEMLSVTLRFLGSGCDQKDLHRQYRLGHTTIGKIIMRVCTAIWETLREESFPPVTQERWLEIADMFFQRTHFPNCIGAIDGKHIRIQNPEKSDRSIVLLAVADADYRFIYIDVGALGNESDSSIFERTEFHRKLESDELNLPTSRPLPGTEGPHIPFVFIGDDAFSMSRHNVVRPYKGKVLSEEKRIFNYRLSKGRRKVESTFEILAGKWKIFQRPIIGSKAFTISVVKTCCALHNYVRSRDGFNEDDGDNEFGSSSSSGSHLNWSRPSSSSQPSNRIRQILTDYFVSDIGSLPCQRDYI